MSSHYVKRTIEKRKRWALYRRSIDLLWGAPMLFWSRKEAREFAVKKNMSRMFAPVCIDLHLRAK